MNAVAIDIATHETQVEAVRSLCRAFVEWQIETFPHLRSEILTYFEPTRWEATLAALPDIHARPKGAMLLAAFEKQPVGCIMYHEMEPGVAEVKRLFVLPDARGRGVGHALVSDMLSRAASDGYRLARLDTARFLTSAIALYEKAGFRACTLSADVPDDVTDIAISMERPL